MILPVCNSCGKIYPELTTPFCCECGGIFDYSDFPRFSKALINPQKKGLWRYGSMIGLEDSASEVSLGEGNTPLLRFKSDLPNIYVKEEFLNPTRSYKDRGSAVLVSFLASRDIKQVVEDSSGNAGASLAAYTARAGIQAKIFIPESASGPKRKQIEYYGAELIRIPGPRIEAARAVMQAAESGLTYASHAFMPFGLLGIATIAYEIAEEMNWRVPGTIVAPVGHGGLLYGIMRGFRALHQAGVIENEPYYLGAQAEGCSPVFDAYQNHVFTLREPIESDTIAEGVRVAHPIRGEAILRNIAGNKGSIVSIKEADLLIAYQELAERGLFVEPTSALVWAAVKQKSAELPEPIIMILTGSGYKSQF